MGRSVVNFSYLLALSLTNQLPENPMIRALGKIIKREVGQPLSVHDFAIPLSDLLLDLMEKDSHGPLALEASQLACSFAHDFVSLATLAGQLLWYVDVAPQRTGTPDSLLISLTAESYLMFLRTSCDVISSIILTFCVDETDQIPNRLMKRKDSFNDLIEWVKNNPEKAPERIRFLSTHWNWFDKLRTLRNQLVHYGYEIVVFTDEIAPQFGAISMGDAELHFLHNPGEQFEGAPTMEPLLPALKTYTSSILESLFWDP